MPKDFRLYPHCVILKILIQFFFTLFSKSTSAQHTVFPHQISNYQFDHLTYEIGIITSDSKGNIWMASANGLIEYFPVTNSFKIS